MADRSWARDSATLSRGLIWDVGYFDVNSSAAVTASSHPLGTVTKTATGQYTLTLDDKYKGVRGVMAFVEASGAWVAGVLGEATTTGTVVVKTTNTSTGADADTGIAGRIYLWVALKNTSVQP